MKHFFFILVALLASASSLEARRRWVPVAAVSGGTPTLAGAATNSAGTTMTLTWSQSCTNGAGGSGGFTVSASGGATTPTYSSGSPGSAFVYNLSRTITAGETLTVSYTQPGNGVEATVGGADVASFATQPVTNNVPSSGPTVISANVATLDTTGTGPFTFNVDCTGSNFIYLFVGGYDATNQPIVSAITVGGVSCTAGPTTNILSGLIHSYGYYLVSPGTGTKVVSISFIDPVVQCAVIAIPMSGVNTSTPVGTGVANQDSSSTNPATVTASSASGELVLGFTYNTSNSVVSSGGQTVIYSFASFSCSADSKAGAASTTLTWTQDTSAPWTALAQPIKP